MGRRIPKQAITGFKFQNETDNIRPFLSIRIRGKDEIIPFKDKKEIPGLWFFRVNCFLWMMNMLERLN